jgi:hypothetical protein
MMGFADVPLEIRRARKSKGVPTPSQNDEVSDLSNGAGRILHRLGSSTQAPSCSTYQHIPSSLDRHGDLAMTKTSSTSLDSHLTSSGENAKIPLSPATPEATSSNEASPKRDYRILQTSNGVVVGTSKAVGKIIVAGLKSPFEVTLSAARGFHNAPRLYGDDTVRPYERITGVWSGLQAAGKVGTLRYRE